MAKTILNPTQKIVLQILAEDKQFINNFYFTGGTVLSEFYLQHRLSEDLDFFSQKEIDKLWLVTVGKKIKKLIKADKVDIQESFNRNLVFFSVNKTVLKTEFTYFPFPEIEKAKIINNIKIDSLIDIAVNKFFTLYQKPTARHFIDLYLIIKTKLVKWENLPKLARIKFDTVIDPLQLGSQLITAKEAVDLPKMIISLDNKQWREYFFQKALDLKPQFTK